MDILRRSMTGVFVYAILLPLVFWPFDFHLLQPQLSWYFAGSMLFISVLRLIHKRYTNYLYGYSAKLWFNLFALLSLGHAAILSTVFAFGIYDPRFIPIIHVTMLAVGGIASGALIALAPRIRFALINLSVLLVPSIIIGLVLEGKSAYSLMITVYGMYVASVGIRSHKEYLRSFRIEQQLDKQKSELETLNKMDALTHVFNRGHFNTQFESQWNMGVRHNIRQTLLLIDVDHFKVINDSYGHLVGDSCLQNIAQLITQGVKRKNDLVARFGGEEFALLLDDSDAQQAAEIAQGIRQAIASKSFNHSEHMFNVTVSVGIASVMPTPQMNSNSLIESADKALYQAKDGGRNQVVVSTESS